MGTREQVLAILENRRGESVSGEELARALNVSRTAVWKGIRELREGGYRIEAVTNKGYCLSPDTDILSPEGILSHLGPGEWNLHIFQTLESTNQTAKRMAADGAPHGAVIIADAQSAGRGRWNRKFYSPAGTGLYMSFVMRPQSLSLPDAALVTAAAAVEVCRAIRDLTGKEAGIKWVNDVFLEGKKVGGILTEAVTDFETASVDWIILGVGLNVTTRAFPPELGEAAGCLFPDGRGRRNAVAARVIERFQLLLARQSFGEYLGEYRERSLVVGREVTVLGAQGEYPAFAEQIDAQGRLVVRRKDGATEVLRSGEVSVRSWEVGSGE